VWTQAEVRQIIEEIVTDLAPGDLTDLRDDDGRLATDVRLIEDCGYHSLALMEMAMSLEDEFELSAIDESVARGIQTLGDIQQHVVTELRMNAQLHDEPPDLAKSSNVKP
jgi:acyl carrier protein